MELIYKGAEAELYLDESENQIIKKRLPKTYRHPSIDSSLIKKRTKSEIKIIEKLNKLNILAPQILNYDIETGSITMSFIQGTKLRDVFDNDFENCSIKLGNIIANLHKNHIVHGDLTTSNMILNQSSDEGIYLIDFGLSFTSLRIEDFAVDLHLLKQALESTHFDVSKQAFEIILNSYRDNFEKSNAVFERLKEVELRGRYKHKN